MGETIRLRPHHLLCIHNFVGKGYDETFTAHMSQIVEMLKEDPKIELVEGCDELCGACPHDLDGVCESADKVSRYDRGVMEACGLAPGDCESWSSLSDKVIESVFHAGRFEQICSDCQWYEICDAISEAVRVQGGVDMDIVKVKNTSYAEYEEVLLRRDNLRKEAEHYHMEYIRVFGNLITQSFEKKIECIQKKKMIAYCQRQVNLGRKFDPAHLDNYITREMAQYREELAEMISDVNAVRNSKRVSDSDFLKIKKIYYKLVKMIHPDMHPELADDETIKGYWQRIVIAYTYNQLKELEELELLVTSHLEQEGAGEIDLQIENLNEKIAEAEAEISNIISTNPYLYKQLLEDETETQRRKQEYLDEIASYEVYSAQLDEVLGPSEIERKLL